VAILRADSTTDWTKVDIEGLRQHLIDMDDVTMRATVRQEPMLTARASRCRVRADHFRDPADGESARGSGRRCRFVRVSVEEVTGGAVVRVVATPASTTPSRASVAWASTDC
jgi:hypothetical protein